VPRARRQLRLPACDLVGHPLEVAERHVAECGHSVAEPVAERRDRARPHGGGVPLEVQLDELGECELLLGNGVFRRRTPSAS
jgi:hypothetical protein